MPKVRTIRRRKIIDPIFGFTIYMQLFGDSNSFRKWFDKQAGCANSSSERNAEIYKLKTNFGLSNKELALRFSLKPNFINHIIYRQRKISKEHHGIQ